MCRQSGCKHGRHKRHRCRTHLCEGGCRCVSLWVLANHGAVQISRLQHSKYGTQKQSLVMAPGSVQLMPFISRAVRYV